MEWVSMGIILLMKFTQSIFQKRTSKNLDGARTYLHFGAWLYMISALIALVLLFFSGPVKITPAVLLISACTAATLVGCNFCSLMAMKSGTISLTAMFSAAGMLVPCIAGVFLFGERITLAQGAGVVGLGGAVYLLIGYSKGIYQNFSLKTVGLLIGSMLCNGGTMLGQKMFAHWVPDGNITMFSFLMFGISSLSLAVWFLAQSAVRKEKPQRLPKPLIISGLALATALLIINQLATAISGKVPSVILFTTVDGGGMVIAAITAAALYHEKLEKRSILGLLAGIASLIIINTFK